MKPTEEQKQHAERVFVGWLKEHQISNDDAFADLCKLHETLAPSLEVLREEWCWLEGLCDASEEGFVEPLGSLDTSVERYSLLERIGEGGMGIVYAAWDSRCERELAMKVCRIGHSKHQRSRSTSALRFLEEARVMSRLEHPGVVPVHDLGINPDGRLFFTMRRVRGHDLSTVLRMVHSHNVDWTLDKALRVLVRVCETVAYAHSQGVIHRDLKPSNIMVGSFERAYVIDWGLAHVHGRRDSKANLIREGLDTSSTNQHPTPPSTSTPWEQASLRTADGAVIGTPAYMAPEQARGELEFVGTRSDIYAAGAILYHLLAGRAPYVDTAGKEAPEVLGQLRKGPPTALRKLDPTAPTELLAICEKAMSRKAASRYESMAAMASDLESHLAMRVVSAYKAGPMTGFLKWARRNTTQAVINGLGVLSLATAIAFLWYASVTHSETRTGLEESLRESSNQAASAAIEIEKQANELRLKREREPILDYALALERAKSLIADEQGFTALELLDSCAEQLRGWEWSMLRSSLMQGSRPLLQPSTSLARGLTTVHHVSGTTFVVGTSDGLIRVIDLDKDEPLVTLQHGGGAVRSLTVSPDGQVLYAGCTRGTISRWELEIGRITAKTKAHGGGFGGTLCDIAIHPSGELIATAGTDRVVKILAADSLKEITQLRNHGYRIYSVAFSPSGDELLTYDGRHVLDFWRVADWTLRASLRIAPDAGLTIHNLTARYSKDGQHIACTSQSGIIYDVEVLTPRVVRSFPKHDGHNHALAFSPNGESVVSTGGGVLKVWDWQTGQDQFSSLSLEGNFRSATFGASADTLISGSSFGSFRILSPTFPRATSRVRLPSAGGCLASSPDGSMLAAGCREGEVMLLDPKTATWHWRLPGLASAALLDLSFSSDGERLAGGTSNGEVWVWEMSSLQATYTRRLGGEVRSVAFTPTFDGLITGDIRGAIHVLSTDLSTHRELIAFPGQQVYCLKVLSQAPLALTGLSNGEVAIVDLDTGALIKREGIHTDRVTSIALSPDQSAFASSSLDGSICLWSCGDWSHTEFVQESGEAWRSLVFTRDGKRLIAGAESGRVVVFELEHGLELWSTSIDGWVRELVASPDGDAIYAVTGFASVHLFDPNLSSTPLNRHQDTTSKLEPLIAALREELWVPSLLRTRIGELQELTPDQKKVALSLVEVSYPDVATLATRAWAQLVRADLPEGEHYQASKRLAAALEILPLDQRKPFMQALSELRQGKAQAALERLEQHFAEEGQAGRMVDPKAHAVELLCLKALRKESRFKERVSWVKQNIESTGRGKDGEFQSLMREARTTVQPVEAKHE